MADYIKPLISVLIPAYNHENYVEEAVLSVINQTYGYEYIQLIVADDCSQDNTASILHKLADNYGFRLILHKENKGLCYTINEMISLSQGEFVISFASDDILVLDRIEKQIAILEQNIDIDILIGEAILIDKFGKSLTTYKPNSVQKMVSYSFDEIFLLKWSGFSAGSAIIRRDLFQRIGTYDQNFKVEDYYFWLKASYNKAKIVKCNIPFIYYRIHGKSVSANDELIVQEVAKILYLYNFYPSYLKALQNHQIYNMSKWIFYSKSKVLKHLLYNPVLFFDLKVIKITLMLFLPTFILKRKFPENYYRYASL